MIIKNVTKGRRDGCKFTLLECAKGQGEREGQKQGRRESEGGEGAHRECTVRAQKDRLSVNGQRR